MDAANTPFQLSQKRILVTGATGGLGPAIAHQLAALGAHVIIAGRELPKLAPTADRLPGDGHASEAFDLAQVDAIPAWVAKVAERHGALAGVVHCAGEMVIRPARMFAAADLERSMRVSVASAFALARGFRQRGANVGGGSIVYLASVMGTVGQAGQGIYSATKGALLAMTRSLAIELARENIRVNTVSPGLVDAGMANQIRNVCDADQWQRIVAAHPLGLGRPEDVAAAVAFLLADASRWITGTDLVVDGGYMAQ